MGPLLACYEAGTNRQRGFKATITFQNIVFGRSKYRKIVVHRPGCDMLDLKVLYTQTRVTPLARGNWLNRKCSQTRSHLKCGASFTVHNQHHCLSCKRHEIVCIYSKQCVKVLATSIVVRKLGKTVILKPWAN